MVSDIKLRQTALECFKECRCPAATENWRLPCGKNELKSSGWLALSLDCLCMFGSVEFKIMRSEKPILCTQTILSEIFPTVSLKQFQCTVRVIGDVPLSSFQGRSSSVSSVWCPRPCARRRSVSSSSTLQIFRNASHLQGLLFPPGV